jgi:hypothetical protein
VQYDVVAQGREHRRVVTSLDGVPKRMSRHGPSVPARPMPHHFTSMLPPLSAWSAQVVPAQ